MDYATAVILSLLLGVVPMIVFASIVSRFERYETKPGRLIVFVFLWGYIFASSIAYVLNTSFGISLLAITGNPQVADILTVVLFAPVIEEAVKGLGVAMIFLRFRYRFNTLLDGIIFGSLVGFGFAAAENSLYMIQGFDTSGTMGLLDVALARLVLEPFGHAMLTSFTGLGLAAWHLSKKGSWGFAPIAGYATAVAVHSLHNMTSLVSNVAVDIAGMALDWSGVAALLLLALYLNRDEKKVIDKYLHGEMQRGTITPDQYQAAVSEYRKKIECWTCLSPKQREDISEFYSMTADLAFLNREEEQSPDADKERDIMELRGRIKELGKEIKQ